MASGGTEGTQWRPTGVVDAVTETRNAELQHRSIVTRNRDQDRGAATSLGLAATPPAGPEPCRPCT